jgi:hypothetical protein
MDDTTRWQDATLPADSQLIGPALPHALRDGLRRTRNRHRLHLRALQAAGPEDTSDDDLPNGDGNVADDEHIFHLLGELDRLWQRPSP